jgi:hypothetical protein
MPGADVGGVGGGAAGPEARAVDGGPAAAAAHAREQLGEGVVDGLLPRAQDGQQVDAALLRGRAGGLLRGAGQPLADPARVPEQERPPERAGGGPPPGRPLGRRERLPDLQQQGGEEQLDRVEVGRDADQRGDAQARGGPAWGRRPAVPRRPRGRRDRRTGD